MFLGDAEVRQLSAAWWHAGGDVLAVLIGLYNRICVQFGVSQAARPSGIVLSVIVVAILLITGRKGWELVYRHRVAVAQVT